MLTRNLSPASISQYFIIHFFLNIFFVAEHAGQLRQQVQEESAHVQEDVWCCREEDESHPGDDDDDDDDNNDNDN